MHRQRALTPVAPAKRKTSLALGGRQAEKRTLIRVSEESGENYLCPNRFVRLIALLQAVKTTAFAAA